MIECSRQNIKWLQARLNEFPLTQSLVVSISNHSGTSHIQPSRGPGCGGPQKSQIIRGLKPPIYISRKHEYKTSTAIEHKPRKL